MKIKGEALFFIILTLFSVIFVGALLVFNQKEKSINLSDLVRSDSNVLGPSGAKATLVEFGDFQCPACSRVEPVIQQIKADYQGKIRLVFRHFPLDFHNNALPAAQASEAAGEQGKFWEFHDLLYKNQSDWSASPNSIDYFERYASELKLDVKIFKESFQSNKFKSKIDKDKKDGNAFGVEGTPTFYLNGKKVVNDYSLSAFKQEIDKLLQ
jgi:protein-disulfide isomerase